MFASLLQLGDAELRYLVPAPGLGFELFDDALHVINIELVRRRGRTRGCGGNGSRRRHRRQLGGDQGLFRATRGTLAANGFELGSFRIALGFQARSVGIVGGRKPCFNIGELRFLH